MRHILLGKSHHEPMAAQLCSGGGPVKSRQNDSARGLSPQGAGIAAEPIARRPFNLCGIRTPCVVLAHEIKTGLSRLARADSSRESESRIRKIVGLIQQLKYTNRSWEI